MNPTATTVKIPASSVKDFLRFSSISAILKVEDNKIRTIVKEIDNKSATTLDISIVNSFL